MSKLTLKGDILIKLANISLLIVALNIFGYYLIFFQIKFDLTNPLIPFNMVCQSYEPIALRGLVLSFGLLISLVLRIKKLLKPAIINDILWIIVSLII